MKSTKATVEAHVTPEFREALAVIEREPAESAQRLGDSVPALE